MNYVTLFLISMMCASTLLYSDSFHAKNISTEAKTLPQKTTFEIETEIEIWLQNYFAKNSFKQKITYTPELFNRIKQHLLSNGYIQYVPHKELKKIIKHKIIDLSSRKHQTDKWILKHKKAIKATVTNYLQSHPQAKPQSIVKYLNNPSCKNKVCKQLQLALKDPDYLPELIKQTIKKIIEVASNKENKKPNSQNTPYQIKNQH